MIGRTVSDDKNKEAEEECMTVAHDKLETIKTFAVKESLDKSICTVVDDGISGGISNDGSGSHDNNTLCFECVRPDEDIDLQNSLCDSIKGSGFIIVCVCVCVCVCVLGG